MTRRLARIPKAPLIWVPKPQPWLRDRDHLDWVGLLPCLFCGRRDCSVAAHIRLGTDGSGARKPSDHFVVPLCSVPRIISGCHQLQDSWGWGEQRFWADFMARGGSDPWGVAQRLWRISGDLDRGYAAIAHARPGMPTAWLAA